MRQSGVGPKGKVGAIHFSGHGITKEQLRQEYLNVQSITCKTD